jgi:NAD(P)-dependent dehydrogenase (short-subunit alcohol dehydrogenase family)
MTDQEVAVVVGVGPGLGWSLARKLAGGGCKVAVAARSAAHLEELTAAEPGVAALSVVCDVGDPASVASLFERVDRELGPPRVVVYNASGFARASILDLDAAAFEAAWRTGCFGGFLVGQAAARHMIVTGGGTILFTGATASLRGGSGFAAFAASKFGLRALAQSMARELGPRGIHVAHVIIDGVIAAGRSLGRVPGEVPDAGLAADAIAETYLQLHRQPRSAWTHELDLRPYVERF